MRRSGFNYEPIILGVLGIFILLGVMPMVWPNLFGRQLPRISFVALFMATPMFIYLGFRMLQKRLGKRSDSLE
jgi:hypothetical protein